MIKVFAVSDNFLLHPSSGTIKGLETIKLWFSKLSREDQRKAGATFSYCFPRSKEGLEWEVTKLKKSIETEKDLKKIDRALELIERSETKIRTAPKIEKFFFKQYEKDLREYNKIKTKAQLYTKQELKERAEKLKEENFMDLKNLSLGESKVLSLKKVDVIEEEIKEEETAAPEQPNYTQKIVGEGGFDLPMAVGETLILARDSEELEKELGPLKRKLEYLNKEVKKALDADNESSYKSFRNQANALREEISKKREAYHNKKQKRKPKLGIVTPNGSFTKNGKRIG